MPDDMDEKVLELRAAGKPIREIARQLSLSSADVEASLQKSLDFLQSGEGLRQSVGLALYRLEKMELKYHDIAMKAEGGDPACAMIALKSNERRAVLSGSTPPQGHAIRMIVGAGQPQVSGTDKIAAVIERLCAEENGQASADEDELDEPGKPN